MLYTGGDRAQIEGNIDTFGKCKKSLDYSTELPLRPENSPDLPLRSHLHRRGSEGVGGGAPREESGQDFLAGIS